MLLTALALHALVQATPPSQRPPTVVRDSTPGDSAKLNAPRRLPVTAEVRATAFRDARARELFDRARHARMAQDSSLTSYDVQTRQRFSLWGGIGKLGVERLVFRNESVSRVQWQRGVGAHIDVTAARFAIPVIGSEKLEREALNDVAGSEMSPIPYFPGSETLWVGGAVAQAEVNERDLVNPLAAGAEAYYTYTTGDSVTFRMPDGRMIQLRELELRPRASRPNYVTGSLWFDAESGQLVRAAYRLAAPAGANISVSDDDTTQDRGQKVISAIMTGLLSPNEVKISAIVVEFGLFGGRFWLPRTQSVEGSARASFAAVKVKYENAFSYASVNGPVQFSTFQVDTLLDRYPQLGRPPRGLDTAARKRWLDSAKVVYDSAIAARRDSVRRKLKLGSQQQCDTSATRVVTQYRYGEARVPVQVRVPCDIDKLIQSPDFTTSIYDPADEVFGTAERERLIGEALSMLAQAPLFSLLPPPRLQFGLSMTRYNRVEGFSTGLRVDQEIGGGYSVAALGRYGFADRIPNWEVSVAQSNMSKTIRLGGYHRLVSASDWGNPLSFGSGLSAFLFGRDEGFYYRAGGAELLWSSDRGVRLDWRAFGERQRTATPRTTRSIGGAFGPNIVVEEESFAGAAVRFLHTYGQDPQRLRLFTDLRLEGAHGDSAFGRGALDLTFSRNLTPRIAAALTMAGGSSVGALPMQRRWFLGGTQTVRGQRPDTAQSGSAFWLGRMELARALPGVRFAMFGDIGWAGDRAKLSDVGRPLSGVGIGLSGFDGLIRFDVARGLYPRTETRVNLYLDARF